MPRYFLGNDDLEVLVVLVVLHHGSLLHRLLHGGLLHLRIVLTLGGVQLHTVDQVRPGLAHDKASGLAFAVLDELGLGDKLAVDDEFKGTMLHAGVAGTHDVDALAENSRETEAKLREMLAVYEERMKRPYLMGRDLIEAGLEPGPVFSEALAYAHKLRLNGIAKEDQLKQTLGWLQGRKAGKET